MNSIISVKDLFDTARKKCFFSFRNYMTAGIVLACFCRKHNELKQVMEALDRFPWRTRSGKRLGICRETDSVMNGGFMKENV
jgi:hypothetical protein